MKQRIRGEWIRQKDNLCPCFQTPDEGPFQYGLGETYFCFAKTRAPLSRLYTERYAVLFNRFSADAKQEALLLAAVHGAEVVTGRLFSVAQLRAALFAVHNEATADFMNALNAWLEEKMIDEIDHRLMGSFQTQADWDATEKILVAKYAKSKWAHLSDRVPTHWHQLNAYTNRLEMIHRTDKLFIRDRPKVTARKRKSGAMDQIDSLEPARKDIDD